MAVVPAVLQEKTKKLGDANLALNLAKNQLETAKAHEFEMQRQYNVHNGGGDTLNANIVWPLLIAARAETLRLSQLVATKQSDVNAAQKEFDDYMASLSQSDQTALNQLVTNQSEAALNASKAELSKTNYASKNKNYIIIGVVIIIVVTLVYYFKFKRKKD